MPYSGASDSSLPEHVKKMSTNMKKMWVEVFNSAMKDGKTDGEAMHMANGVVKKAGKKSMDMMESWDFMSRQVPQDFAEYDSLGASATEGCANCQFFCAPFSCSIVMGDISPTGICKKYYTPKVDYPMEPMPVTVVSSETKEIDESMNPISKAIEWAKSIFNVSSGQSAQSPPVQTWMFYKQEDERLRFVAVYSNCFKDKSRQIITAKAHEEYINWADETQTYPELWLWHTKGTKWGQVDWIDISNGFVVASGLVDEGKEYIAKSLEDQKDSLGVSHGFLGAQREGYITKYRTFEISPLPRDSAANVWTHFNVLEGESDMAFSDKKRAWLKETSGSSDDVIKSLEETTAAFETQLKEMGIEYKEAPDQETSLTTEMSNLTQAVTALLDKVSKQESKIEVLSKSIDDRVAELFVAETAKVAKGVPATESTENVVGQKEAQKDVDWFGEKVLKGLVNAS